MPQDASDTSTASAPAFVFTDQTKPSTTSSASGFGSAQAQPQAASGAPAFRAAKGQAACAGPTANAPVLPSAAWTKQTSADTAGVADRAPVFGGAAKCQPGSTDTAGSAPPASSGAQAPTSFRFPSAASTSGNPFPFSVPGRPMDSRIKDACATGFMGINLDSTAASDQGQMPAAAHPSSAAYGSATAGWGFTTAEPSGVAGAQPSFASFKPAQSTAFAARFGTDAASQQFPAPPTGSGQAAAADPTTIPSPPTFTIGAKATPKQPNKRPMFGSEHLATNLHDRLVLEAELAAAQAAASTSSQSPVADSASMPAQAGAAAANTQGPAESVALLQQPAVCETASAPASTSQLNFLFGAGPAAANTTAGTAASSASNTAAPAGHQPWPHTFTFGAAPTAGHFSSQPSFSQSAAARCGSSKAFVFGATQAPTDNQPSASTSFPPNAAAAAAGIEAASVNAGPSKPSGWSASDTRTAEQKPPMQFSAGQAGANGRPRNGLQSPAGTARHAGLRSSAAGARQQSRAVPGSPQSRRSGNVPPHKHTGSRPNEAPGPHSFVEAMPRSQWSNKATSSSAQPDGINAPQQQVTQLRALAMNVSRSLQVHMHS